MKFRIAIFPSILLVLFAGLFHINTSGQSSVLINFGRASCGEDLPPAFSLIKNPLTASPSVMNTCEVSQQLPDFYNVFIAFNPKDNKIYLADIRTGATKIWILDIGLPGSIECPASIPVEPNYTYSYVSNNFEFDRNGDLWSLSDYNAATGQCNLDKFDITTGQVINSRILQFPAGHFPTAVTSGDICVAPNGRMFATLGTYPSQLYEITNYNTASPANAAYLKAFPLNVFGIAYLDSKLEATGFDDYGCYYYTYNLATTDLMGADNFQNGQLPVDNSSFTPAIGTTKQIVSSNSVNSTTTDIVYEIYIKNMGNVMLNNINVTDDLAVAFGAGNISNVSASFANGTNAAGLTLNPAYNGVTETRLLTPNQQLPNQSENNTDYFCKIRVACRVSNINPSTVYYNSAIASATINNAVDPINVSDSSNNGNESVIDPNNDGNPAGIGENVPTPFSIGLLPVHFLKLTANLSGKQTAGLQWSVATPVSNGAWFEPQYSADGTEWQAMDKIPITDIQQKSYYYLHNNIPGGNLYYRVKQVDKNGQSIISSVVLLQQAAMGVTKVYPNPASNKLYINTNAGFSGSAMARLYDMTGRLVVSTLIVGTNTIINIEKLPKGTYVLKLSGYTQTVVEKIVIDRK